MDGNPDRRETPARLARALLQALAFVGTAGLFTLVGYATILLAGGRPVPWRIAVVSVAGLGGASGVFAAWKALRPPDRR